MLNIAHYWVQFSHSVVSDSATPWSIARQASLPITSSKLTPTESVMPPNHLIPCRPLLLLSSIPPSIRVFSNESALHIRWPKYWSFSFSISPSNEHPALISFRMDWLDLLAVQGTLESLLQDHSSKASILWCSAFFIVQLSHPYMTTGKTTALTRWTFVDKVMSLLFNMLSRVVITFLPRSKRLIISWLQSSSAVILEPRKIKSAIIIEMQIKTTMRYYLTSLRMAIIKKKKSTNNRCWRGCGEKGTILHYTFIASVPIREAHWGARFIFVEKMPTVLGAWLALKEITFLTWRSRASGVWNGELSWEEFSERAKAEYSRPLVSEVSRGAWFQDPCPHRYQNPGILRSYIKWCSVCVQPVCILLYTLNHI